MKSSLVLAFVATFAFVASVSAIDWSKVEPLHINPPNVPVSPPVSGRIVGGQEAKPHSFPYQAALLLNIGEKQAFCGGSVISAEYVLTAAHCAQPASGATVILGAHNIKEEEPNQVRITVPKENLIVHESWSQTNLRNDIALVKLTKPIEFNEYIQPLQLPSKSQAQELFVGVSTIAYGWGKDSDKATAVSPVLRFVNSKIITKRSCNIRYFGVIQDTHICMSGDNGKSTCNGDSGGPLVINEGKTPTQIGLTSFGIAFGCEKGWPAVFTRLTSYLDWISGKTGIEIRN